MSHSEATLENMTFRARRIGGDVGLDVLELVSEVRRLNTEILRVRRETVDECAKLIEAVRVRTWSPEECAYQIRARVK